ncbi:MAG: ribulose-phosphate 3-epimerase [Firmicutes bacterium]|nr:ribulose-phosphate 3-epimerase [Bacillota bacterium]
MIKIAPSILSADFSDLAADVKRVEIAGADYLHIDVMDGHFVPNITIGPLLVKSLRKHSSLVFDTHLMIENPDLYIDQFVRAGADIITIHAETCPHLHRTLTHIKESGVKVGVALNPATPLVSIENVVSNVDLVLIMTVNPGFGGQVFINEMIPKIKKLRAVLDAKGIEAEIQVDGGINEGTAYKVVEAGANVLVAGSAIFNNKDPVNAVKTIRERAILTHGG